MQWPDAATGLSCIAVRQDYTGHWCGYVGVSPGYPLHGRSANEVELDAHRDVNFAGGCEGSLEDRGICHKPAAGESDHVWWFGFDCMHIQRDACLAGALGVGNDILARLGERVYRTLDYVKAECTRHHGPEQHPRRVQQGEARRASRKDRRVGRPTSVLAQTMYIIACHETGGTHCIGWLVNQVGAGGNLGLRQVMFSCTNADKVRLRGEQHPTFEDTLAEGLTDGPGLPARRPVRG